VYKLYLLEKTNGEIHEKEIKKIENELLFFSSKEDAEDYFNDNFDLELSQWNINYMYASPNIEHYFKIIIKEC
jgi:hypothetical protein